VAREWSNLNNEELHNLQSSHERRLNDEEFDERGLEYAFEKNNKCAGHFG
jgi:hypothetical protein